MPVGDPPGSILDTTAVGSDWSSQLSSSGWFTIKLGATLKNDYCHLSLEKGPSFARVHGSFNYLFVVR